MDPAGAMVQGSSFGYFSSEEKYLADRRNLSVSPGGSALSSRHALLVDGEGDINIQNEGNVAVLAVASGSRTRRNYFLEA